MACCWKSLRRCCLCSCFLFFVVAGATIWIVWKQVLKSNDVEYDLEDVPETERPIFVSPAELQSMLKSENGATILDARTRYNVLYERTRPGYGDSIDGARSVEWKDFTLDGGRSPLKPVDEIERIFRENGVSNDIPVVVFGSWKEEWGEEGRVYWQLDWLNHTQAYILHGGIFGWTQGGFTGRGRDGVGDFVARPIPSRHASSESINALLGGNSGTVFVDARSESEFNGATPHGSARGGHIPGAVVYDWRWVFDQSGSGNLKPPQNLTQEFRHLGIRDTTTPIIVYCTSGVRAGFLYAVFRWAGYESVANYADSWYIWSRNNSLPIEV